MNRAFVVLLFALLMAGPAGSPATAADSDTPLRESIVTGTSKADIPITATFSGDEFLIFGAIERNRLLDESEAPPDIILLVKGPERPMLVRKKERAAGIWVNRHFAEFSAVPSFYAVASSAPVEDIVREHDIEIHDIGFEQALLMPGTTTDAEFADNYRKAAIDLHRDAGLYTVLPGNVRLIDKSLFAASIHLPSNIIEGDYGISVLLARDDEIVQAENFIIAVRKTGIGRWIYRLAQEKPLTYGLLSILFAIAAGWFASETFRRLHI